VAKVAPASGKELKRIPLGGAFGVSEDAVWLWNDQGLIRIDQKTYAIDDPLGEADIVEYHSPKDVVVAFDSAWVACKDGHVIRLDLETGSATDIKTAPGAHTFAVAFGSVWVTNYDAGSVSRIDPVTNTTVEIEGAGSGIGITSGDGYIWAAAREGIAKIDPASNAIVGMVDLGRGEYYELIWDDGHIWASTRTSRVLEIDPSK
jgi:virginiamycin B lyase